MHDPNEFLRTLALVLGVAAVTTILFQRLRQPVVFGYMLAGLIVGPHVPIPLVANEPVIHTLSELGVILLMFTLGLEFSLRRLLRAGWPVVIVAVLQSSFMMWLGYVAARLFGWGALESAFAGAAVAISSTTIIVKAFAEQGLRGRVSELVFGILIIEDLIAILLLALLTPASSGETASAGPLGMTILRLVAFLAISLAVGMLTVPRLIRLVVRLERPETTLVACIGVCFGAALLARSIGYSVALGAFLAGSLVAESGEGQRVERLVEPVRDMFAAMFFVSVGMLIDPRLVMQHWAPVVAFTGIVLVGKVVAVSMSAFLTGAGTRTSVQAGMSLAQIGEFSFIIAGVGLASGATSTTLYPIMVAVSALTTLTTPWLIGAAPAAAALIDRNLPRPLQTFVALYGSWIEALRARPETTAERDQLHRALRVLLIDAFVIAALAIGGSMAASQLGPAIVERSGLTLSRAHTAVIVAAILLTVPFFVGILRTGRTLGTLMARRSFPDPEPGKLDLAAAPRRAFVSTVQVATVLMVGAPVAALVQPFMPPLIGLSLLGIALVVLAVTVWRTASDLQGHVRAAAEAIVTALGRQSREDEATEGERALKSAYKLLPGLGEPVPVRLDAASPGVGLRLSQLGLRGRTGATILAISRGEDVVLVPDGHEVLKAGDVLALAGTQSAIETARELLLTHE
ncbi:MAG: potassium transporter [Candidatus Eisenbacteria bacterium]|uniref:Potassium transporter n=1 Tax=Eiseniibacteriota bacterium TaxID=2212470 RepID=A0A849SDT4_UNCEI|nr:potassium transporter [Candidatus Eisenbacteria bacterium]